MPEGDTIFKVAEYLRPRLEGTVLQRVELHGRVAPSLQRRVESVTSWGKHLLIGFDSGEVIRSHLGLHGSWHRYAPDARWRLPRRRAWLLLRTVVDELVCFDAEEIECLDASRLRSSRALARLGPDLCRGTLDLDLVVRRAGTFVPAEAPVVDLLLDQRVAAGIGNVYKSEILFLEGIHPRTRVDDLGPEPIRRLYSLGRRLLRSNLGGWHRTTTVDVRAGETPRGPRLWVYGRAENGCLRCGRPIESARTGRGRRSTYWCPVCQAARGRAAGSSITCDPQGLTVENHSRGDQGRDEG